MGALPVTVTPDTRAPELAGTPTVDGATLVATFDEALDPESSRDASGGFTVTVTRGPGNTVVPDHAVTGIAVLERTVTLTLAQPVRGRDTVTLDYDPAGVTDPLQRRGRRRPTTVAAFSGQGRRQPDPVGHRRGVRGAGAGAGVRDSREDRLRDRQRRSRSRRASPRR